MAAGKVHYTLLQNLIKFANAYHVRKVVGTLKGYDQLMNLVLDDVREFTRGPFSLFTKLLQALTYHS